MFIQRIVTILQGVIMGIVETIPGVSASTMALIMGIYEHFIEFLHAISDVFKSILLFIARKASLRDISSTIKEINLKFGGFLVVGMLIGLGVFSHIMSFMLEYFRSHTFAFFFGLILASIIVPLKQIEKPRNKDWLVFILSAFVFFFFFGLNPPAALENPSRLLLFIGGYFSVCAMVLPGVSGSFVLLLFGLYDYAIGLVKGASGLTLLELDLVLDLVILALGLILGFGTFVRVLKKALQNYKPLLMALLAGLMVGSLRILIPFTGAETTSEALILGGILIITAVATFFLNKKSSNNIAADL